MQSVSIEDFIERLEAGARAFDTRPLASYRQDALPGVAHLSLEKVQAGKLPEIDKSEPIYLICERGMVSELAGLYLEAAGFRAVYNVEGGMIAWRRFKARR
jgi:rhodanese-related sulfurtransferase